MSWSRRNLIVFGGAALLGGCGFQPLYQQAKSSDAVPQFSAISIEQSEGRTEQLVRNHLLDMITPRGEPERPLYRLEMKVTESISNVLVTRSEDVTRNNMSLLVSFRLLDYRTGDLYFSGSVRSLASYNLLRADFANLVSERDARARAAKDCAEQLRIRLGNYFTTRAKT